MGEFVDFQINLPEGNMENLKTLSMLLEILKEKKEQQNEVIFHEKEKLVVLGMVLLELHKKGMLPVKVDKIISASWKENLGSSVWFHSFSSATEENYREILDKNTSLKFYEDVISRINKDE